MAHVDIMHESLCASVARIKAAAGPDCLVDQLVKGGFCVMVRVPGGRGVKMLAQADNMRDLADMTAGRVARQTAA